MWRKLLWGSTPFSAWRTCYSSVVSICCPIQTPTSSRRHTSSSGHWASCPNLWISLPRFGRFVTSGQVVSNKLMGKGFLTEPFLPRSGDLRPTPNNKQRRPICWDASICLLRYRGCKLIRRRREPADAPRVLTALSQSLATTTEARLAVKRKQQGTGLESQ